MRSTDIVRLWMQLLAMHPNRKFWMDPKNREEGFKRFKKSLLSENPLVGLMEMENYTFMDEIDEGSTTEATIPSLQPESPPTMQTLSTENDATSPTAATPPTANVEILNIFDISLSTDSESEKPLDIRLKQLKERSRIVKTNSKKTYKQNKKIKKLCDKQMKKHFKETVKDCLVEDLSVIPKRPRGRPAKKKDSKNNDEKKNETGMKRFKFIIEYKPVNKIVLLPNKMPNAAHPELVPLDLVMKPLDPTNSIEFEHEQETPILPLDLSLLSNPASFFQSQKPDEISNMFIADLDKSIADMPNLDNDEFSTFMDDHHDHHYNEMQLQSVVPGQIYSSHEGICSDRQETLEENIEIYVNDARETSLEINSSTITPENTDISIQSLIAADQDKGSINTPDKNIIDEKRNIANQTVRNHVLEFNTQTESISPASSNPINFMELYSEKDLEDGSGGGGDGGDGGNGDGIDTNLNILRKEKSTPNPRCHTKVAFAWNELELSLSSDSSSDDNRQQDNMIHMSINEIEEERKKEITDIQPNDEEAIKTRENNKFNVSDLVDTNETLDFEPDDDDDILSVATSWNGSDEEFVSSPKKTKFDMKEVTKESKSDPPPKPNENDTFCFALQPINKLSKSTILVEPHTKKIAFKIPKTKKKIDEKLEIGKNSAVEQQQEQQLPRHPEQQANRVMIDPSIPRLINSGPGSYTPLPAIARQNSVTFIPRNVFSPQPPMASVVTPYVDNMPTMSSLRKPNSRLNQQANLHKWCKDIFGITCVLTHEGNCPGNCKQSHEIHNAGEIQNTLFRLNRSELKQAYIFAKRHKIIFEKTMRFFVATYAIRKQINDILFAINDCILYPNCCEQLLAPIHDSLIQCGYSALNACIEITSRVLNQQHIFNWPKLLDKITEIIMSSGWIRLFEYVVIIMNMPNYKLPPSYLSTILNEALWSDNIDLIKKIIETLSMLDVSRYKENVPKLKQLLLKMQSHNLSSNERVEEQNHNSELSPDYVTIFKEKN